MLPSSGLGRRTCPPSIGPAGVRELLHVVIAPKEIGVASLV
jgi:hypothetical protein